MPQRSSSTTEPTMVVPVRLLREFVEWFQEHDGKADDFGRFRFVAEAEDLLLDEPTFETPKLDAGLRAGGRIARPSRWQRWRLRRAELKLADLIQHDEIWVSGFGIPRPPSEIDRMKRRIARAEARVSKLGGDPA